MKNMRVYIINLIHEETVVSELPVPAGVGTFDEFTMTIPGGAYTGFRTYDYNKTLRLDVHLKRLIQTAQLAGQSLKFETTRIRQYLLQIVDQYPQDQELRFRIVIGLYENFGDIYLMSEILNIPGMETYQNGVKLETCNLQRDNPKAKLTHSIPRAEVIRSGLPEDVYEGLMLDKEGCILEGLTSNFFAIKGGELWTNELGVLSGVMRSLVIEVAQEAGIKINFESMNAAEIPIIEEAFITSSSRAILPVVQIDNVVINPGKPGRITRRLMKLLENRIRTEIQPI